MKYLLIIYICLYMFSCQKENTHKNNFSEMDDSYSCMDDSSTYYIVIYDDYGITKSSGYIKNMERTRIWKNYNDDGEIESKISYFEDSIYTVIK